MELYKFVGTFDVYHYHSGDVGDITTAVGTYTGQPIKRKSIENGLLQDELELEMPSDLAPLPEFIPRSPYGYLTVTVFSYPDLKVLFSGVIANVEFMPKDHKAKVKISNLLVLEKGTAPFRTFSQTCSWELFGTECGVIALENRVTDVVTNVVFNEYTIFVPECATKADGYFDGGFIEFESGQRQYVVKHQGANLSLLIPVDESNIGNTIAVYAGCDKTEGTCSTKFDNIDNFSGYPKIPVVNPVTDGF